MVQQGANNLLHDVYRFFREKGNEVHDFLSTKEIKWKFIPPSSPHWGGLWEAGIKSTKYHLRRATGNRTLTFEQLTTVLSQIEALLNSRPLCPLSTDPRDLTCLTPGHFLIGKALTAFPERDVSEIPDNRLKFFEMCSKARHQFWKCWSAEYLNRLQHRPKRMKSSENLKQGTMVLVKEDNLPPLQWHLARVIEIFPGKDGKARVAKILTSKGSFKRPISKLSLLPFE